MAAGFGITTYSVYPYLNFENQTAKNKKTILVLSDSFGRVFAPFLSLDVENLFHYTPSNVINFLDNSKPDIIVLLITNVYTSHLRNLANALKDY
jgi:hypothetical protein